MALARRSPGGRNSGNPGCTEFLAALTNSLKSPDKAGAVTPSKPAAERITAGIHGFPSGLKRTTFAPVFSVNHKMTYSLRADSFFTSRARVFRRPRKLISTSFVFPSRLRLPDLTGLLAHHWLAFFAAEGLSKFRHIRKRSVAAESGQRVRVGVGHQPREFNPLVSAPDLRPAEEEAL